jgi:aspartyl-tRNA(Asn)/glutamyl-tRNA(Gln) amidotransferase subunit C
MHIDAEQVRRIADLARIDLADGEADGYIDDLEAILTLVDRMQAVATDGIEPLAHPLEVGQRLRPDAVSEADRREALQAGAPQVEGGFFVVPRVIE